MFYIPVYPWYPCISTCKISSFMNQIFFAINCCELAIIHELYLFQKQISLILMKHSLNGLGRITSYCSNSAYERQAQFPCITAQLTKELFTQFKLNPRVISAQTPRSWFVHTHCVFTLSFMLITLYWCPLKLLLLLAVRQCTPWGIC